MDSDDYNCGTCKHGVLYDSCRVCENEYEKTRSKAQSAQPDPRDAEIATLRNKRRRAVGGKQF